MPKSKYKLNICGEEMAIDIKTGRGLSCLFEKLKPKINNMAINYYIDGKDIPDNIQDLHFKILKIIPSYNQSKSTFYTYTINCLKNFIIAEIKKNRTKHNVTGYSTNHNFHTDKQYVIDEKDLESYG